MKLKKEPTPKQWEKNLRDKDNRSTYVVMIIVLIVVAAWLI